MHGVTPLSTKLQKQRGKAERDVQTMELPRAYLCLVPSGGVAAEGPQKGSNRLRQAWRISAQHDFPVW